MRCAVALFVGLAACRPTPSPSAQSPGTDETGASAGEGSGSSDGSSASTGGDADSGGSTTAPGSSSGAGSSGTSTGGTACAAPPAGCPAAAAGTLVDVTKSAVGPYLLRRPTDTATAADTILFMPGGPGSIDTAMPTYDLWLGGGDRLDDFVVVVPYGADGNVQDELDRVIEVLDEVLGCTCTTGRVHLGGTSLGGLSAYALALDHSDRFVTLLGAPGNFASLDARTIVPALEGKSVFNGVGENDTGWHDDVVATHTFLVDNGIDSQLVEFPGEGHILTEAFDESIFFEFWSTH